MTKANSLPAPFAGREIKAGLGGRLFISGISPAEGSLIAQIDSETGALLGNLPRGYGTGRVEISPDRRTLYLGESAYPYTWLAAFDVSNVPVLREEC